MIAPPRPSHAPTEALAHPATDSPTPPLSRSPALRHVVVLLAVLLTLATRLPELDRYATIDESRWVGRSADFASYIQQRDFDRTFIVGHPGVTTMWLGSLGLGPAQVRAMSYLEGQTDVTRRDNYLEALVAARTGALIANAIALGSLVWVAWGLFGPGAAVFGGLLLMLDPFLSAHTRLIHLDGLLTSFMTLAALSSIAYWGGRPWPYLVLAGLATGLALLTKAPSVYLLPFVPALAFFEHLRQGGWRSRSGWARLAGGLAAWLSIAVAICWALWPAFRLKPMVVSRQMIEFAARNSGSERDNFFLGQPVEDPGLLFYPLALLFRATPLLLLGLAVLVVVLVRRRQRFAGFWPALLLGGYASGFLLMMSLGQKKFDRYELPVFPPLDLLAGLGLWLGWCSLRSREGEREGRRMGGTSSPSLPLSLSPSLITAILLVVLAAWPLASVFPYHLAYYNPLLGGGSVAQRVLFVGWGEGLDRVAEYVNAKPLVFQAPLVASAYHRALQAHLHGNTAMPLDRAELADYIVPYVNSLQRDQDADVLRPYLAGQEPEHVVWLNGIEYARVYRGPRLPVERVIGADSGGAGRLESVVVAPGSGRSFPGDTLALRLRWRPAVDPGALVQVVRLRTDSGQLISDERQPLARATREGDLFVADVQLALSARLPSGEYRLEVGLEEASGRALAPTTGGAMQLVQSFTVRPLVNR